MENENQVAPELVPVEGAQPVAETPVEVSPEVASEVSEEGVA